jgi:hypothetical protein
MCSFAERLDCYNAWEGLYDAILEYGNGNGTLRAVSESLDRFLYEFGALFNGPRGEQVAAWRVNAKVLAPIVFRLFRALWVRFEEQKRASVSVRDVRAEVWPEGQDGGSGFPVALTRLNDALEDLGVPWRYRNFDGQGGHIHKIESSASSRALEDHRPVRLVGIRSVTRQEDSNPDSRPT